MEYTHIKKLKDGSSGSIGFITSAAPIKPKIEESAPWPEDWVDPYYMSCIGEKVEEEEDDDDDYEDPDFLQDTGPQIQDAPPLDIL